MHEQPERGIRSLEELGEIAGISRARFATHIHSTTGADALRISDSLAYWGRAVPSQEGEPLKMIAPFVGYDSVTALNRSISHHVSVSPKAWLASQQSGEIKLGSEPQADFPVEYAGVDKYGSRIRLKPPLTELFNRRNPKVAIMEMMSIP